MRAEWTGDIREDVIDEVGQRHLYPKPRISFKEIVRSIASGSQEVMDPFK
jgi:hypothetical protein